MSGETSGAASTGSGSDSVVTESPGATEATSAVTTAPSDLTASAATETTTTADTGSGTTTGGLPWGECTEPFLDWNQEHVDCLVDWPTMTTVHGEGPAAGLMPVTRVFFGVETMLAPMGWSSGRLSSRIQ